jgi:predicted  nucleic acid-binding Zn-ribbon protein
MIAVEEVEAIKAEATRILLGAQNAAAQRNSRLAVDQTNLSQEIARMENERQATAGDIIEADLKVYQQLRQTRRGIAVSHVKNKACSACGSMLNAALLHAARLPNQINRCDTCGRILYSD